MLETILIIFIITAAGGSVLVTGLLKNTFPPLTVSLLHAFVGIAGILLLLLAVVQGVGGSMVIGALWLFSIAAMGGLFLGVSHGRRVLPPKAMVLAHSSLAVIAVIALFSAVMNGE